MTSPMPFYELEKIYQVAKEQYPLEVVFVKNGDNLITFDQDKVIVTEVLPVPTLAQQRPEGGLVEFTGFPVTRQDFINTLIDMGFTLAVLEQGDNQNQLSRIM